MMGKKKQLPRERVEYFLLTGIILFLLLATGCSDEDGTLGTGDRPGSIAGVAQKGPFVSGSTVTIQALSNSGEYLGDPISTTTNNDLGHFSFEGNQGSLYLISITGRFYDEVVNQLSTAPITLNAVYLHENNDNSFISVNILTQFIHQHVLSLLQAGKTPADALYEAQDGMRRLLQGEIIGRYIPEFQYHLASLYNESQAVSEYGNALLLYFSASLNQLALNRAQQSSGASVNELTAIVNEITTNYATTFQTDPGSLISLFREIDFSGKSYLDPSQIDSNLKAYSLAVTGETLPVPDITEFVFGDSTIDADHDGISNDEDANPNSFEILPEPAAQFATTNYRQVDIALEFNIPQNGIYDVIFTSLPNTGVLTGSNGETVSLNAESLRNQQALYVYTPNSNFIGSDSFSYYVKWRDYSSSAVTVSIDVLERPTISQFHSASSYNYILGFLTNGLPVYVDSNFVYTGFHPQWEGASIIETANDDASITVSENSGTEFIAFDVDVPVTVYVLYTASATAIPAWLENDYVEKPEYAVTSSGPIFRTFARDFPAGSIVLHGNMAPPALGADYNYTVVVR